MHRISRTFSLLFSGFFILVATYGFGQKNAGSRELSVHETDSVFPGSVKQKLGIRFPIFKAYQFQDRAGTHYLVLTENVDLKGVPPLVDTLQGFCFLMNKGEFIVEWTVLDFILANGNPNSEEFSIWFWTRYVQLTDTDKDGYIEPILVYGTSGVNETSDGRVKILVYHRGAKRAIRHQNGVLDPMRNTRVDSMFYELPPVVQEQVKKLMVTITKDENAIFPHGWETAMRNKELYFDEN
jgi:hypothetical protein